MKKVYKLTPSLHENIWGGTRLGDFGKNTCGKKIGESWELSFVEGAEALADGVKLTEAFPKSTWGSACEEFDSFPVLTKFIDAGDNLSVQVHPSDEYALENEGQYGKTEMWYVIAAEDGAGIYMGLKDPCEPERFASAVAYGSVEELLNFKEVGAGDVYFIPAGTVHAIGKGVLIFEIQQNSTLTYRLYDYMRTDDEGKLRELHVEKAMKVSKLEKYEEPQFDSRDGAVIGRCKYFTARRYSLKQEGVSLFSEESYISVTCTDGVGEICGIRFSAGDSFFAPAGGGRVEIFGTCDVICISQG